MHRHFLFGEVQPSSLDVEWMFVASTYLYSTAGMAGQHFKSHHMHHGERGKPAKLAWTDSHVLQQARKTVDG